MCCPICLEPDFDTWPILTYCDLKVLSDKRDSMVWLWCVDLWGELSVFGHNEFWPIRLLLSSLSSCALKVNIPASLLSFHIRHCHSRQDTIDIKDKGSRQRCCTPEDTAWTSRHSSNFCRTLEKLGGFVGIKLGWGMTTLLVLSVCLSPPLSLVVLIRLSVSLSSHLYISLPLSLSLRCANKINNF